MEELCKAASRVRNVQGHIYQIFMWMVLVSPSRREKKKKKKDSSSVFIFPFNIYFEPFFFSHKFNSHVLFLRSWLKLPPKDLVYTWNRNEKLPR